MGRLFWKFFLLISLAQLAAVIGISHTLWVRNRAMRDADPRIEYGISAETLVSSAAQKLQEGGTPALRSWLEARNQPTIFALDESNRELLGRHVPPAVVQQVNRALESTPNSRAVRRLQGNDGRGYLLFAPAIRLESAVTPPPAQGPFRLPWIPLVATLVGSLICAALLAQYLSKPIRNLRAAFDSAAGGNLSTRVSPQMAKRNDELANLGRDFDRMATQLQALLENRRRLFHDVSHELRSPLARLQIATGLARQHPDTVQTSLERIERECKRMDELVGELLTLSKLETGVIGATDDEVDLSKLIADIVEDARFESGADGRRITFGDRGPIAIRGRAELLHRAIENVLRNALKHTPDNTPVEVKTSVSESDAAHARITIEDEGPGIPKQELGSIFQPFFRGAAAHNTQGHGLGLSIARQVVEAHGGTIRASNRESGGLRVEILLPIVGADQLHLANA